ncbi:MAG TPA: hypothetical protein VNI77_04045 [Nitrososphaera sp.]|nr:hypothetical protein [Nitrososphaera sp.]
MDRNSVGRTELALEAKVQYARLVSHLKWLEKRKVVDLIIKDDTINVTITDKGKEFAFMLLEVYGFDKSMVD